MSWTTTVPPSSEPPAASETTTEETCDALVADFLRAHGLAKSLRALEVATSGRCSSGSLHRLRSADGGLEDHESENAFACKLEAMASYSSKYDEDGDNGGGRRGRGSSSSSSHSLRGMIPSLL